MANKRISDLTALTTPASGDLAVVVDVSDTTDAATGTNKKITLTNLLSDPDLLTDASTTAQGVVEEGTQTEVNAGTAAGTKARLFVNPSTLETWAAQSAAVAAYIPAGSITMYGGTSAPTGYLLCDGSEVSRSTYSSLFTAISTNYGVGNGTTTFNVPDLKSRFPVGYSGSAPTKVLTFASRSSNTITVTGASDTASNEIQTGQAVVYHTTGTDITGLTNDATYYLVRVANNQFTLSTSAKHANTATVITLSGDGTGTRTFTLTYTARAIGEKGGTETQMGVGAHYHKVVTSFGGGSGAGNDVLAPDSEEEDAAYGYSTYANDNGDLDAPLIDTISAPTPTNMPLYTVVNYIVKT